jgi:tight adherence protein B
MDRLRHLNMGGMDFTYALGLLGVFVAACLLTTVINQLVLEPYLKRSQLKKRMRQQKCEEELRAKIFKAYQESRDRNSPVTSLMGRLTGWGRVDNLERQLIQADLYIPPGLFILVVALMGAIGFVLGGRFLYGIWIWVAVGVMGWLPIFVLRWKKRRKTAQFEKQMPEAMELLARSLRAGHTLPATMELVAQEVQPPLGKEMRITYEEQRLGLSVPQALRRMGERVASQDLRYFVTAVLVQNESGGNLAEILENIGTLIRGRMQLKGKVHTLTAEGRFSALVLMGLPVLTFLALYFMNRNYIMILFSDPLGKSMLGTAICSMGIGAWVMKKMVSIKV